YSSRTPVASASSFQTTASDASDDPDEPDVSAVAAGWPPESWALPGDAIDAPARVPPLTCAAAPSTAAPLSSAPGPSETAAPGCPGPLLSDAPERSVAVWETPPPRRLAIRAAIPLALSSTL